MRYQDVILAIANTAASPGAWVHARDVAKKAQLTYGEVVSVAGALHDNGFATVIGFGNDCTMRLDAITINYPDGTVGVLVRNGRVVASIDPQFWAASAYEIIHPTGTTNAGSSTT